jgi:hypothetical protein
MKTALEAMHTDVGVVSVTRSGISNASNGTFDLAWTIIFQTDRGNRPQLEVVVNSNVATDCEGDASGGSASPPSTLNMTTSEDGIAENNYTLWLNSTNSRDTRLNITGMQKGTSHLFKVAVWNEAGLSVQSLPSEPKSSAMSFAVSLGGVTESAFDGDAQTAYLQVIAQLLSVPVNDLEITGVEEISDGGRRQRRMQAQQNDIDRSVRDVQIDYEVEAQWERDFGVERHDSSSSSSLRSSRSSSSSRSFDPILDRRFLGSSTMLRISTTLRNVSATQAATASADLKMAVADTGENGLSQNLQNVSIATTGTTLAAAPELTLIDPVPQASTVPSTITQAPTESGVGGSKATLSWTTPADNGGSPITGYAIWYNNTQGSVFTSKHVVDTGSTATEALVEGLLGETKYYFAISAINENGLGLPSPAVELDTAVQPDAPVFTVCTTDCASSCVAQSKAAGTIVNTVKKLADDCAITVSNTDSTDTSYYYIVYSSSTSSLPLVPVSLTPITDSNSGWSLYNSTSTKIQISQAGSHTLRAISVRGGEFQSYTELIVSIDVPYTQVENVAFSLQSGGKDLDPDRYEIQGQIALTQGDSKQSSLSYRGYWGVSDDAFLNKSEPVFVDVLANEITDVVVHTFSANTRLPQTDPPVTHLLVTAVNEVGENFTNPAAMLLYDFTGTDTKPLDTAKDIDLVDLLAVQGRVEGNVYIHSANDTTTVQSYTVYWSKDATGSASSLLGVVTGMQSVAVSSSEIILVQLSAQDIPTGADYLVVKTANSDGGEMEASNGIAATRILDRVDHNLLVRPWQGNESAWFGEGVNAVVCRVDREVGHARVGLAYVNDQEEIQSDGEMTGKLPLSLRQATVQYPYFARDEHLLGLGSALPKRTVQFNPKKRISCVETT